MFAGIAGGVVAGFIVGTIYGKYVISEATAIKNHVTAEIAALKADLKKL